MELNITNLTTAQIEQIKKQIEEMEKENKVKIDFSKYIGKLGDNIAIKWDKMLKSYSNWDISHNDSYRKDYNEKPKYTLTTLSELKEGDVFIRKNDVGNIKLENFSIFVWNGNGWEYMCQYLKISCWMEVIDWHYNYNNHEVYKFLRD